MKFWDFERVSHQPLGPRGELVVLAVACFFPTFVTLVYFEWASGTATSTQQTVYGLAKAVQFALPVAWVAWAARQSLRWPDWTARGVPTGALLGLTIGGAMWLLYALLAATPLISNALGPIQQKLTEVGIDNIPRFAVLGLFYALVHSLLEEYYWRWFVFGHLERIVPSKAAIGVSSFAFALHHVVVLWHYFSHMPWVVALFSLGVAVGGALWAALYRHSGSLLGPWISHLLVDAAIFSIGLHMAWAFLSR